MAEKMKKMDENNIQVNKNLFILHCLLQIGFRKVYQLST